MFPRDRNLYGLSQPTRIKDRHGKVFTSKGLRDQRMRLSIETVIKLYDLQDRLGFDRPSKTVEWLLQQAQPAVHELSQASSDANVCESSALSSSTNPKKTPNEGTDLLEKSTSWKGNIEASSSRYSGRGLMVLMRRTREKAITNPIVRKESRSKARERARERTRLKNSAKQKVKVLPQQALSESVLRQGALDSTSSGSYSHIQKAFQLSSSQEGVCSVQSNVATSSELSTCLQPTVFQQDVPSPLEFSSDVQFFCNKEILQIYASSHL